MTFAKTVLAYLTGWLIAQPVYNRVFQAWKRREMAKPNGEYRRHLRDQAREFVDALDGCTPGQDPLAALDIVLKLRAEVDRLAGEVYRVGGGQHGRPYPREAGDSLVLGPDVIAVAGRQVICWKGENYYLPAYWHTLAAEQRDALLVAADMLVNALRDAYPVGGPVRDDQVLLSGWEPVYRLEKQVAIAKGP